MNETSLAETPSSSSSSRGLTRRRFLTLGAGAAGGLALYSGEIERHLIEVVPRTIVLKGLPSAFAGFRIVQLSDVHFEEYTEAFFLREAIRKINTLQADMVVLTGDYISNGPLPDSFAVRWCYGCAEILREIQCPVLYSILGNHDAMVNAVIVTDALVSHGIPVLSNNCVPIERDGKRFWLAGIADALRGKPDLAAALATGRRSAEEPIILLAHEPDFADFAVGHDVALVLSGHTHGGQIRLPFLPPPILPKMGKKYVEGLYTLGGGMQLYVNRGLGTVGVPFRLCCPPEITVITLQPDGGTTV